MADLIDVAEPILAGADNPQMGAVVPFYISETDLVHLAYNMHAGYPSFRSVYEAPDYLDENYILLQPRLDKYGRAITKMVGDGSCYWRSFSHQCWHTQEYHLFARFATAAYMRKNVNCYAAWLHENNITTSLFYDLYIMDRIITEEGPTKGQFPGAHEIQMRASCDLFGVKIERLYAFGDEVISELCPRNHKYNKEIGICYIAEHADSMFPKDNCLPNVDASLIEDRAQAILFTGRFTFQDFMGCLEYPC